MRAPFPWFGGKRSIAADIWRAFGDGFGGGGGYGHGDGHGDGGSDTRQEVTT